MSHYLTTFGTLNLPACGMQLPLSIGPVEVAPIPLLSGGAMNPYGAAGLAVRRGAVLSYRVTVSGKTPREFLHNLDAVMAPMGTQDTLTKIVPDDTYRWVTALMLDTSGSVTVQDTRHAAVTLTWLVLSPYWYASAGTDSTYSDMYDGDDLPVLWAESYDIGDTVPMPPMVNAGNAPVHDVVFTITADGCDVTSVTIVNTTTDYTLVWTGTLVNGNDLVIDCGAKSITNNGVDAYYQLIEPANQELWMELAPGDNAWLLRLTGCDAIVRVQYASAWK
jgi:hypothetical protein